MKNSWVVGVLAVALASPCWAGASRDFNGSTDDASIAAGLVEPSPNLTLAAWVFVDNWGASGTVDQDTVFRAGTANDCAEGAVCNFLLEFNDVLRDSSTHRDLYFMDDNNYAAIYSGTGSVIDLDEWNFLFGVHTTDSRTLYVNCVSVASDPDDFINATTDRAVNIGGRSDSNNDVLDGMVAHAQVYSEALTVNDCNDLMRNPAAHPMNLLTWIPFFGTDSPETDLSGHGNSATLGGTVASSDGPPIFFGNQVQ